MPKVVIISSQRQRFSVLSIYTILMVLVFTSGPAARAFSVLRQTSSSRTPSTFIRGNLPRIPLVPATTTHRLLQNPLLDRGDTHAISSIHARSYATTRLHAAKIPDFHSGTFRADRVLANRSGKTRKECTNLLKYRRVWEKIPDDYVPKQGSPEEIARFSYHLPNAYREQTSDQKIDEANADTEVESGLFRTIAGPSLQIRMDTVLVIDQKEFVPLPPPLAVAYHKPKWVLSVRKDPKERPCLEPTLLPDLHPVGRLDYDSEGLLLFSSSGQLTQTLLHPKHETSKEYVATVTGKVVPGRLRRQLERGVETSEGVHTGKLLDVVEYEADSVKPYLDELRSKLPPEYNQTDLSARGYLDVFDATELSVVRLEVTEGKHRMVRRMLANCGHPVVTLKRERIGNITLGNLEEGKWRTLSNEELEWVKEILPKKKKENYSAKRKLEKAMKKEAEQEKREKENKREKKSRLDDLEYGRLDFFQEHQEDIYKGTQLNQKENARRGWSKKFGKSKSKSKL